MVYNDNVLDKRTASIMIVIHPIFYEIYYAGGRGFDLIFSP